MTPPTPGFLLIAFAILAVVCLGAWIGSILRMKRDAEDEIDKFLKEIGKERGN